MPRRWTPSFFGFIGVAAKLFDGCIVIEVIIGKCAKLGFDEVNSSKWGAPSRADLATMVHPPRSSCNSHTS